MSWIEALDCQECGQERGWYEFENGNIVGTSAAVRLSSGCARSAAH
jgi:hypothetical protein